MSDIDLIKLEIYSWLSRYSTATGVQILGISMVVLVRWVLIILICYCIDLGNHKTTTSHPPSPIHTIVVVNAVLTIE